MTYAYNIGTVPYNGGTTNNNQGNSHAIALDDSTFVWVHGQRTPDATFVALGRCPGGFGVGVPAIESQTLLLPYRAEAVQIEKMTSNRFAVASLQGNNLTVTIVQIESNALSVKSSTVISVSGVGGMFSLMSTEYVGQRISLSRFSDDIVLVAYRRNNSTINVMSITYDDISDTVTSETILSRSQSSSSPNFDLNFKVFNISGEYWAILGACSLSNESLNVGNVGYTTRPFHISFSDNKFTVRDNYTTINATNGSNILCSDYVPMDETTALIFYTDYGSYASWDGFDVDPNKMNFNLTPAISFSETLPEFSTTKILATRLDDSHILLYNDNDFKKSTPVASPSVKVLRYIKDDQFLEPSPGSSTGNGVTFSQGNVRMFYSSKGLTKVNHNTIVYFGTGVNASSDLGIVVLKA